MEKFFNFIKDNYSYIIYIFQFILVLIGSFVAFIKSRRLAALKCNNDSLLDGFSLLAKKLNFYTILPDLINSANILYPIHGQGDKRFEYVYERALHLFGCEDSYEFRSEVSEAVDSVLNADNFEKIFYPVDTQVLEPKKELYEKKKDVKVERPESLCQDGKENKSAQCSARYVSRRD